MIQIIKVTYTRQEAEYIIFSSMEEYEKYGEVIMNRPDVIVTNEHCSIEVGNTKFHPTEVKRLLIDYLRNYDGFEEMEQNPEIDIEIHDNYIARVHITTYGFKAKKIKKD